MCQQEQVSGGTTNTVLRNLLSDTLYTVTVVPVYPEGEGLRQSEKGKTRKSTQASLLVLITPAEGMGFESYRKGFDVCHRKI